MRGRRNGRQPTFRAGVSTTRTWGRGIEPLAPAWSSCATPYVSLQLRQHAGREEPGRRKPVAFFNEKQALIDMRVLLAER